MSDIAEDMAEELRQVDGILSPVKSSHVGGPCLDVDSEDHVGPNPRPSCSKVGAKSLPRAWVCFRYPSFRM